MAEKTNIVMSETLLKFLTERQKELQALNLITIEEMEENIAHYQEQYNKRNLK